MVRMNTQGLQVPVHISDFKNLPIIPNTATRVMKKKNLTDFGPRGNCSLDEIDEEYQPAKDADQPYCLTLDQSEYEDPDTTTVFDLVHRGRQRDQHFRALRKVAGQSNKVCSPKIMSPIGSDVHGRQRSHGSTNCGSTRGLHSINFAHNP